MDNLTSKSAVRDGMMKYGFIAPDMTVHEFVEDELLSIPAVPLDKLSEFLADTLHTPAPCFNNEEICPRMDFGYCRLPDAPDVKECWKKILTKWMEGLNAAD